MMSHGVSNQAFSEVKRKVSIHSLNISVKDEYSIESEDSVSSKEATKRKSSKENRSFINNVSDFKSKYNKRFKCLRIIILNLLVLIYFMCATIYWIHSTNDFNWCNGYGMLVLLLGITYIGIFYQKIFKKYITSIFLNYLSSHKLSLRFLNFTSKIDGKHSFSYSKSSIFGLLLIIAFLLFIIFDTAQSRNRLISLSGICVILGFGWIFSKHPSKIHWKPVIWGLVLQFAFGLFTIRWTVGRDIFQCISKKVNTLLNYAESGSIFVFSEEFINNRVFAFTALPVIFFFSLIIQVLYYLGVMQGIIYNVGWILHVIMETTVCESINSAANTFLGMTESPLLIKPYLNKLTTSEIHAIMCSGFATVSGSVLAAYIKFGANPAHLITASIMSSPAALCFSKLFYPETDKSITTFKNIPLEKSKDTSIIDAATKGALAAIPLISGIIANIIAFISFVAFLNGILSWLGAIVGYGQLNFELILAKVFMPLSWLMGVPWSECEEVGTLIGLKTVVNEFIAYQKLGELKGARRLSPRTEAIATYAICGFSNPSSVGIMIGSLAGIAPEKREQITSVAIRAFVAGSAVCFLTASIAGVLIDDNFVITDDIDNSTVSAIL